MRCVGIDLGGTAIKAGAVSPSGAILAHGSRPTGLEQGAAHVLDTIAELARELGAQGGLGLGVPGLVDHARGRIESCPNLKAMERLPLRAELARRLGFDPARIVLENDANAAAVGEHWLGTGRGERDLLLVTLGTGVGGGLILDGKLYVGPGGMAGEIGHVVVEPGGRACGCGAKGCVETLASATAAARRARELGLPRADPGNLVELARLARENDGPERELLHAVGRDLGYALATVVALLDVRTFVIGGGFGAATDVLAPGVLEGIRARSYGERIAAVRVLPALLGADAGWIGAAAPLAR